ncbi:alpha/beta hydrolase [Lichenibacterium minor]|uniref:Alpha/beta hydrolase n=1 Tax=Lichenibacterium minor TaxID=2316528 RepID=A0A4Q2UDF5_9HYPH|nr:alpha/beta hydrolase [Lichenibacterium minor]RYC33331.1 alpha/beta hydrolase [Lichenibacterium minor]
MAASAGIGSAVVWHWRGRDVVVGTTRLGSGPRALLLPALSSISTRAEMAPLAARLEGRFTALTVDWPGFGAAPKPPVAWSPEALGDFLRFALDAVAPEPALVVAAGHAAGYLLAEAAARPVPGRRLVLLAPTWRGPLPTMLKRRPAWLGRLARAADVPGLGAALYRLNVNPAMVRAMARAHVYSDPAWLTPERAAGKRGVTGAKGARHAAVRFVTGQLDPFADRAGFIAAAEALREPALVIYGADAPPKSRAEMEALSAVPGIATRVLPRGKLSLHEEFPDAVAAAILEGTAEPA